MEEKKEREYKQKKLMKCAWINKWCGNTTDKIKKQTHSVVTAELLLWLFTQILFKMNKHFV